MADGVDDGAELLVPAPEFVGFFAAIRKIHRLPSLSVDAVVFGRHARFLFERFSEQAEMMEADRFGNRTDGFIRLAQQQGGLFEAVFDEVFVGRRLHQQAECTQAGGLAAGGALREVTQSDVFGVVCGDVLEHLLRADGIDIVGFRGGERCVLAQQQHEREQAHEDVQGIGGGALRRELQEFAQQGQGAALPLCRICQRAERQGAFVKDGGEIVIGGTAGQKAQLVGGVEKAVVVRVFSCLDAVDDVLVDEDAFAAPYDDMFAKRLHVDDAVGGIEELQVVMPVHDVKGGIERQALAMCRFAYEVGERFGRVWVGGFEIRFGHGGLLLAVFEKCIRQRWQYLVNFCRYSG